jgi:GH24 family phage-related lysozyme (muramidase)/AraC-like DNA-binding protein
MPTTPQSNFNIGGRQIGTQFDISQQEQVRLPQSRRTENLAATINSLMVQTGDIVHETQRLTGNAALRVAESDSLKMYQKLEELDRTKTAKSSRNDLVSQANEYLVGLREGRRFDDEEVQMRYDEAFKSYTTKMVQSRLSQWKSEQSKIDIGVRKEEFITNVGTIGSSITPQLTDEYIKNMSDIYSPDEVYKIVSTASINDFQSKWKGQYGQFAFGRGVFDDAGKLVQEKASSTFNEFFNAFATMDNDGNIEFRDGVDAETKDSVSGAWNTFINALPRKNGSIYNEAYETLNKEFSKNVSDADSGSISADAIRQKRSALAEATIELTKGEIPTTAKQAGNIRYLHKQLTDLENKRIEVDNIIKTNPALAKTLMLGGKVNLKKNGIGFEYSPAYMTNVAKSTIGAIEQDIRGLEAGSPEHIKKLDELVQLSGNLGVSSSYITTLSDKMTGKTNFRDIDEIRHAIVTGGYLIDVGGYATNEALKNSTFKRRAEEIMANDRLNDAEKVAAVNYSMQEARTAVFSRINTSELQRLYRVGFEEATDAWLDFDTSISSETKDALLALHAAQDSLPIDESQAKDFILRDTVRIGGFFASLGASANPFNDKHASLAVKLRNRDGEYLKDSVYETALEAIVDDYNKRHPQAEIDVTDIHVASRYRGGVGADEVSWVLYAPDPDDERRKGRMIGTYNGDSLTNIAVASKFDSDYDATAGESSDLIDFGRMKRKKAEEERLESERLESKGKEVQVTDITSLKDEIFSELKGLEGTGSKVKGDVETYKYGVTKDLKDRMIKEYGEKAKDDETASRLYIDELVDEIGNDRLNNNQMKALVGFGYNSRHTRLFSKAKRITQNSTPNQIKGVAKEFLDAGTQGGMALIGLARRHATHYNDFVGDKANHIALVHTTKEGTIVFIDTEGKVVFRHETKGIHPSSTSTNLEVE